MSRVSLNGVETLSGQAIAVAKNADGSWTQCEQDFKAIPYFAWANRGPGEMIVWLADSENSFHLSAKEISSEKHVQTGL